MDVPHTRRRAAVVLAATALAVATAGPAPARADYRITGHGFGHGVGMSQYGAMGYAANTRHTWRWIVSRYFPGTHRDTVARTRIRVRLKQASAVRLTGATL